MAQFTHLHLHTEYSLLDGVGRIQDYLDRAKSLGMTSLAITDHGNLFGAVEFYKKAKSQGVKPIIGLEAYVAEISMESHEGRTFHLILLAETNEGYENLIQISSIGYTKGFYKKPRVDKAFLAAHSKGLIALSACLQGEIPRRIQDYEGEDKIDGAVGEYLSIFGPGNYFLEVQANGIREQRTVNEKLLELSRKHGIPLVATNDTHYVNYGDHTLQDVILCIQTGAKLADRDRMRMETDGLWLKSGDDILRELGSAYAEAVENAGRIAERCHIEIRFDEFKFPDYQVPGGLPIETYLRQLVREGLARRYPGDKLTEEIRERTRYELDVIEKMGYAGYFVVVWDFIDFSVKHGIPIGPGRGSAAGSIVAYALGITQVDPIRYNLIFERFLNPERISMPDIDVDICQERRQEVVEYVTQKYGSDKVAQIITFGTLKARAVIKDVGRVMDVPLSKTDALTKLIDFNSSLAQMKERSAEFRELCAGDPELRDVVEISEKLENRVRHASIHAAGIVITKDPLTTIVPLYSDSRSKTASTQYQAKELESLGLLKMDFLGLRNLTILQRSIDSIRETEGKRIDLQEIPLDDPQIYKMLSAGDTSGVFQLESAGVRRVLTRLRPDRFEDIIAVLALYRPGPLGSGMVEDFISCRHGETEIKYPDDSLKDILEETYGVILYQEQVMKIASKMAGYSLGEADILRRAMGKKDVNTMKKNKERFVAGALSNGHSAETAGRIFDLIDKFGGYGFNKSHSAAYALVAYWTAWFKVNYTKHYYAAILTSEISNIEDVAFYIADARTHKIKLSLPDVNRPGVIFKVDGSGIVFALTAIKNVGWNIVEGIVEEREKNGDYTSLENFALRTKKYGLNKKSLESLILAGALDSLPGNRKQKFDAVDRIMDYASRRAGEDEIQQMNLFGGAKTHGASFTLPETPDFSLSEKLAREKETLGFYCSSHPLDIYAELLDVYRLDTTLAIKDERTGGNNIKICGILREIKKIVAKKSGDVMATFYLEDYYGALPAVLFPKAYKEYAHILTEGKAVYVDGFMQTDYFRDQETKKLIVNRIRYLEDIVREKNFISYILITESDKAKFQLLKHYMSESPGDTRVVFAWRDSGRRQLKPTSYRILPSVEFIRKVNGLFGEKRIVLK
ncbi:MAG: DNA polymerase III subunit alpha [Fusobacteriaceae bacterium]|jgi:DNA polymerase-3 subunit alpha|nr:DNA polymerase III subunit alpha [Fusobacteriaceae bacterium]